MPSKNGANAELPPTRERASREGAASAGTTTPGAAVVIGTAAVEDLRGQVLRKGCRLLPVYHCGNNATRTRPEAEQRRDWKRVKAALDRPKPDIADHQRGFAGA